MVSAARQPLGGWRNEACLIPITVPGADLSGRVIRAQVRNGANASGAALLDLEPTTDPAAIGIRTVGVSYITCFPTTSLMLQVPKASMQGLPYVAEAGQPDMRLRRRSSRRGAPCSRFVKAAAAAAAPMVRLAATADRCPTAAATCS